MIRKKKLCSQWQGRKAQLCSLNAENAEQSLVSDKEENQQSVSWEENPRSLTRKKSTAEREKDENARQSVTRKTLTTNVKRQQFLDSLMLRLIN